MTRGRQGSGQEAGKQRVALCDEDSAGSARLIRRDVGVPGGAGSRFGGDVTQEFLLGAAQIAPHALQSERQCSQLGFHTGKCGGGSKRANRAADLLHADCAYLAGQRLQCQGVLRQLPCAAVLNGASHQVDELLCPGKEDGDKLPEELLAIAPQPAEPGQPRCVDVDEMHLRARNGGGQIPFQDHVQLILPYRPFQVVVKAGELTSGPALR